MPYLSAGEPPADSLSPPLAVVRDRLGFVPSIFPAQGLLPRVIEAEASLLGALLLAPGAIPWVRKEEILAAASSAQRNLYCVGVHARVLRGLGTPDGEIEAIAGGRFDDLGADRSGILAFAVRLAASPESISGGDVERLRALPLGDEEILEVVQTAALNRLLCTLSAGLAPRTGSAEELPSGLRAAFDSAAPPAEAVPGGDAGAAKGPFIRTEALTPEEFPPFAALKQGLGFVPAVFRAQGLARGPLEAEIEAMRAIVLAEDVLSRTRKELVLLAAASASLDVYSAALHAELLRGLGVSPEASESVAAGRGAPGLPAADSALVRFAEKLASRTEDVGSEDVGALRAAGFADPEILEAIVTTAFGAFLGTLAAGLGARPDFRPPRAALEERRRSSAAAPPVDDPDRSVVETAKTGDAAAFEELLRRYQARVYRTLAGLTGSAEDAEDGCQAVFLRAFHKLGDFAGASRFSTWLTRIAIREGLDRIRRRHPTESLDDAADEDFRPSLVDPWVDDPERLYEREEIRQLVRRELARLPVRYRAAVMLRDIEQLSTAEAAAALELPVATLKTRLLRGRLLLREALAAHFSGGSGERDV